MVTKNFLGLIIISIGCLSAVLWLTNPVVSQPLTTAVTTATQPLPFGQQPGAPWTDNVSKVVPYSWLSRIVPDNIASMRSDLSKNPSLVDVRDAYGRTGLMVAAELIDLARADMLISYGAQVNLKSFDNDSATPLHIVMRKQDFPDTYVHHGIQFIKLLLAHGADLNSKDSYGRTPLHYISEIENRKLRSQILEILMQAGANINAQDNLGDTPLHIAVYEINDNAEDFMEEVMNKYGNVVDPHVRNLKGETVVDTARNVPFMRTVQMLCKTGKWPCSREDLEGILK